MQLVCCSLKIHPIYVNGASVNSFECKLHLLKRRWSYPQTKINSFVSVGTSQKFQAERSYTKIHPESNFYGRVVSPWKNWF